MPDPAKFAKLRKVGYRIPVLCGLCRWGTFTAQSLWGRCDKHQYEHGKHSGIQKLGIHRYGTCDVAQAKSDVTSLVQSYLEFAEWQQSETS